jgi:uncharacterized protein (TIGR03437 family)
MRNQSESFLKALSLLLATALPVAAAATAVYVGGDKTIQAARVAVDGAGNRYVTGAVLWNVVEPARLDPDIFLAKIAPDGAIVYTIYFGGDYLDEVKAIAVDPAGRLYLTGTTSSFNFPAVNALQPALGGRADAFLCRMTAAGGFDYCTFLGGSGDDSATAVAVDATGAAYVTGETRSADFPVTAGALQTTSQPPDTFRSPSDAFVAKISADGRSLLYSTYLGGRSVVCIGGSRCIPAASRDAGLAIAVDASGNATVAGRTNSSDFPVTAGAFQTACRCDFFSSDIFVAKLNAAGSALLFSTYLGGRAPEILLPEENLGGMAVDREGNLFLTGSGWSPGPQSGGMSFPTTPGAFQVALDYAGPVPFVAKLAGDGSRLLYSTFLSGRGAGAGSAIAIDDAGTAFITGTTAAADFPRATGSFSRGDNFFARLSPAGSTLEYATLLPNGFGGADVVRDRRGGIHLLGPAGYLSAIEAGSDALPPILGVANAAGSRVTGRLAPGELVSLFGVAIGPDSPSGLTVGPNGLVTTELGGVQVLFQGRPAPLTYAQKDQVNAVVPMLPAAGEPVAEIVRDGRVVGRLRFSETPVDPQVFSNGPYAAAINEDGAINSFDNPARLGSIAAIYATGLGRTFPPLLDGEIRFADLPQVAYPVELRSSSGRRLEVLYAGQAPGLVAGVMQINFRVEAPEIRLPSDLYFELVVGGVASSGSRIAVAP